MMKISDLGKQDLICCIYANLSLLRISLKQFKRKEVEMRYLKYSVREMNDIFGLCTLGLNKAAELNGLRIF